MTYHLFFNKLISFIKQFNGHYIITWDAKKSTEWRKDVFEDYKSNRTQNSDSLILFKAMDNLREILPSLPIYQYMKQGFEADDIIFKAASEAYKFGSDITILSNDSDLLQVVQRFPNVVQFDPKKNIPMSAPQDYNIAVFKALSGDSTDHIPGVKGIGKVTAEKYSKEVFSLNEVSKLKHISKLLKDDEKIKQFKMFFDIVNIENNPNLENIDLDMDFLYKEKTIDEEKLKEFFEKHNMKSHLGNFDKTINLLKSIYN